MTVFVVDPYNLFNISRIIPDETKLKCIRRTNETIPRGTILWKTIKYKRNPTQNIILGDSRIVEISPEAVEESIGVGFTNLSVAGSNYRTIIELFKMAESSTDLKNVIIQANFDNFNVESSYYNLFSATEQLLKHKYTYFLDSRYLRDTYANIYYTISRDEKFLSRGYQSGEDNWEDTSLGLQTQFQLNDYTFPVSIIDELKEISEYCIKDGINLIFVIAPNYYEVNSFLEKNDFMDEYYRFKSELAEISYTIDLDTNLPISYEKEFYADHFHLKSEFADTIVYMISKKWEIIH